VRKLAVEAADNGLLAPELANGITRVKEVASKGIRLGNWLPVKQAQTLLNAPGATTTKGDTFEPTLPKRCNIPPSHATRRWNVVRALARSWLSAVTLTQVSRMATISSSRRRRPPGPESHWRTPYCTPRRPTESAKMEGVRAYQPSQSQSCGCPTVALGESDRGWAKWCSGGPTQLAGDWFPTLPARRGASAGPLHPVASTGVLIGPLRTSAENGCWAAINGASPGEYSLSGIVVSEVVNVRIDRTLIDENRTLWIIDYKSRSYGGSAVEAFPDN
jgi:hypothetical protein